MTLQWDRELPGIEAGNRIELYMQYHDRGVWEPGTITRLLVSLETHCVFVEVHLDKGDNVPNAPLNRLRLAKETPAP